MAFALDALPAVSVAVSLRRLLTGYATNKAITVRRTSDSATQDIGFLANGDLDLPSLTAFLASTTGFITTWYDQSGSGFDLTQGVAANQPGIKLSEATLAGRATSVAVRGGSLALGRAAATPVVAQPLTISAVAVRTGSFASFSTIAFAGFTVFTGPQLVYGNSANAIQLFAGATVASTATDNIAHALLGIFNGASSSLVVDGVAVTGNVGAQNMNGLIVDGISTQYLDGFVSEVIIFPSALSAADAASLQTNQDQYWIHPPPAVPIQAGQPGGGRRPRPSQAARIPQKVVDDVEALYRPIYQSRRLLDGAVLREVADLVGFFAESFDGRLPPPQAIDWRRLVEYPYIDLAPLSAAADYLASLPPPKKPEAKAATPSWAAPREAKRAVARLRTDARAAAAATDDEDEEAALIALAMIL